MKKKAHKWLCAIKDHMSVAGGNEFKRFFHTLLQEVGQCRFCSSVLRNPFFQFNYKSVECHDIMFRAINGSIGLGANWELKGQNAGILERLVRAGFTVLGKIKPPM